MFPKMLTFTLCNEWQAFLNVEFPKVKFELPFFAYIMNLANNGSTCFFYEL